MLQLHGERSSAQISRRLLGGYFSLIPYINLFTLFFLSLEPWIFILESKTLHFHSGCSRVGTPERLLYTTTSYRHSGVFGYSGGGALF